MARQSSAGARRGTPRMEAEIAPFSRSEEPPPAREELFRAGRVLERGVELGGRGVHRLGGRDDGVGLATLTELGSVGGELRGLLLRGVRALGLLGGVGARLEVESGARDVSRARGRDAGVAGIALSSTRTCRTSRRTCRTRCRSARRLVPVLLVAGPLVDALVLRGRPMPSPRQSRKRRGMAFQRENDVTHLLPSPGRASAFRRHRRLGMNGLNYFVGSFTICTEASSP